MNFEIARHNMIEQQIRPWNVIDPVTLDALDAIPRENYVLEAMKESAFSDVELPIGHDQVMLFPKIEAKILQSVQVQKTDTVLEIGTGSGYMTALLAHLADKVCTVEIHEQLSLQAQEKLAAEGFDNVTFVVADAAKGFDQNAPYDVIILTGSVPQLPESFKQSLKKGGRLFAVIGTAPVMEATLITRVSSSQYSSEVLFETEVAALENVDYAETFTL
ncbi:MAG: protein-L-isoaspartate O-methyltransferase [gamma proteobacterium symbiont of Lucinoma myriamae]|nr:protein-L-isoaspartate O-methyltransferase [gamma proteobacterium symbiont of Lucinoma myriamae]MCU7832383.1 protein-L-isoaspartate O-methyltransferase [gamma proteobacterium symbiont of Lucinoma myriamae]